MKRLIPVLGIAVALPLAACNEADDSVMGVTELDSTFESPPAFSHITSPRGAGRPTA